MPARDNDSFPGISSNCAVSISFTLTPRVQVQICQRLFDARSRGTSFLDLVVESVFVAEVERSGVWEKLDFTINDRIVHSYFEILEITQSCWHGLFESWDDGADDLRAVVEDAVDN